MDTRWLKGLKGEERQKQKERISQHKTLLNEIADILEDDFEEGVPNYESPSWAFEQADRNGANRKLREVIKFLRIKDKTDV